MHDVLLLHTFSQSHRRTIDVNHLAKRQTAFVIERASSPAASAQQRAGKRANVEEADVRKGIKP